MATQETGAPTWAGAFQNILDIEESHGFDNKAVMGGLDKFLARWSEDMATQAAGNEGFLLKEPYDSMSAAVRADWTAQWREALGGPPNPNKPPKPAPAAQKKKPAAKKVSAEKKPTEKKPAYKTPPAEVTVDAPVDRLRGVDTKLTARLKRLDVETIRDLLYLFPRRHEDYSTAVKISELSPGEECTVVATVWEAREVAKGPRGGRRDTEAVLSDETGNLKVIWFGSGIWPGPLSRAARSPSAARPARSGDNLSSRTRNTRSSMQLARASTPEGWCRSTPSLKV